MLQRLVFNQLPGQSVQVPTSYTYSRNATQGLQFKNGSSRVGLNLSMINRVVNSRPGCGSCGK